MSAFLIFVISVVGLYVFMVTFGSAMDSLYVNFAALQPSLALPATWNAVATKTLTYWQFLYRSVVVIVIALGIWVIRVAVIDVDYTRQQ
jgi:hypothetical protein